DDSGCTEEEAARLAKERKIAEEKRVAEEKRLTTDKSSPISEEKRIIAEKRLAKAKAAHLRTKKLVGVYKGKMRDAAAPYTTSGGISFTRGAVNKFSTTICQREDTLVGIGQYTGSIPSWQTERFGGRRPANMVLINNSNYSYSFGFGRNGSKMGKMFLEFSSTGGSFKGTWGLGNSGVDGGTLSGERRTKQPTICNVGNHTYANGDKYDGLWKDGLRHGQGTMTYANGDSYDGDWMSGKIDEKLSNIKR
ncbi:uncharacterized protein METZ01_LOCUS465742, partial [marine metagenome]